MKEYDRMWKHETDEDKYVTLKDFKSQGRHIKERKKKAKPTTPVGGVGGSKRDLRPRDPKAKDETSDSDEEPEPPALLKTRSPSEGFPPDVQVELVTQPRFLFVGKSNKHGSFELNDDNSECIPNGANCGAGGMDKQIASYPAAFDHSEVVDIQPSPSRCLLLHPREHDRDTMEALTDVLGNGTGGMLAGHLAVKPHTSQFYDSGCAHLTIVFIAVSGKEKVCFQIIDTSRDRQRVGKQQWAKAGSIVHLQPGYWIDIYNNSNKKCLMAYHQLKFPVPQSPTDQSSRKRLRGSSCS
jgi:hypothetical protein